MNPLQLHSELTGSLSTKLSYSAVLIDSGALLGTGFSSIRLGFRWVLKRVLDEGENEVEEGEDGEDDGEDQLADVVQVGGAEQFLPRDDVRVRVFNHLEIAFNG